jgi:[acyl-carrier-protein] S-malonyltransferase
VIDTVLVFEGQGARSIPGDRPDDPPVELATLTPVEAQTAIVRHQVARAAAAEAAAGRCAVLGQSLGEISALVVAGALQLDDALEVVRLRAELPAKLLDQRRWTMASLTRVRRDTAVAAAAEAEAPLWIIGDNGPADCIVVGEEDAFRRFADQLGLTPKTFRELPVVHPYHTPAMQPVADAMAAALADLPVAAPALPMLSPTGPRMVDDASGAQAVVVDALVSPVAWSAALTRAAGLWPQARWRECGPSASLYRFVWKNGLSLDWAEA